MEHVNFGIVLGIAFFGALVPGPATLSIAGTSMARGRLTGLTLAWGVVAGSVIWACFAAVGIGALLTTNKWMLEFLRYAGGFYLAWLSYKSARSAMSVHSLHYRDISTASLLATWTKGALIHLTNPKTVLFWGSVFAIGLKPEATSASVAWIIALCLTIDIIVVTLYAFQFSSVRIMEAYLKMRRWFEGVCALLFGGAAIFLLYKRTS